MFIEERHQAILEHLNRVGRISAGEIQEKFGVSFDTARRDLRILEDNKLLKRTHGGALPVKQIGYAKPVGITAKDLNEVYDNYNGIAKEAASMIKERDVVFITSASVGYLMTGHLPLEIAFTAVTNSIIVAEELRKRNNIRIILTGGEMDEKGSCKDAFAVDTIKRMRFDKCFITAACISSEFGLSIQSTSSVSLINAVIDSSKEVIGLFPTEKMGSESIISICPVNKLSILITDWDAPEQEIERIKDKNVQVVIIQKQ